MEQTQPPCKGCEVRFIGCHGKDRDGAWRCEQWGALQDKLAAERQRTAGDRMRTRVDREYIYESVRRNRKAKLQ